MLLRPPFIQQQDVKSQTSNENNPMEREKSVKSTSKNKKKQNTLGMRKKNMIGMQYNYNPILNAQTHNNYDSDHGSVHSVNSRRSKGKTKESTIAIAKKQPQNIIQNSGYSNKDQQPKQQYEIFKLDSDEQNDNKSIGSHASRNSKKNTVKESSLGKNRNSKVNVQLNYYYNQKEQEPSPSPRRNYMEEESKVQVVKLNENVETFTQPLKYNEALKGAQLTKNPESRRRTQQVIHKPTSSPFEQITLKRQDEQDEPVYRLKEPEENFGKRYKTGNNLFGDNNTQNVNMNLRKQQNPFGQRNNNVFAQNNKSPINFEVDQKKDLQESNVIQPQMISTKSVTKSRRNKIFDNDNNSISNSSNIMNSGAYLEGSFEEGRSKSKSKLGELLKESREKKEEVTHTKEKEKEIITIKPQQVVNTLQSMPQHNPKQNFGYNFSPVQNQPFEQNKNIIKPLQRPNTYSVNPQNENIRLGGQKLIENHLKHEPIQRKSIENEVFDLGESQTQLNLSVSHKNPEPTLKGDSVFFNFEPEKKKGLSITSKEKPSNKSLESKKHLDRLMRKCQENQEFLAKSILSNNSELRQSNKPAMGSMNSPNNIVKKEETLTRPFERIKEQRIQEEPAWHQMVKNDAAFQIKQVERREIRRPSQEVRQISPPELNKPISPAEFFRMENQMNSLNNVSPKQEQIKKPRVEVQSKNERKIQQQKNKLLVQISKKPKQEPKQQIPTLNKQSNQNPISAPIYDRASDQEINLNFSDAFDGKLKQIKNGTQKEYVKDQVQTSLLSHQLSLSENGSEKSNSQSTKKQRKKQSSLNIMKKHKVQVREQDPRAEESFYEQPPKQIPHQQYKEQVKLPTIKPEDNFKLELSNTKVEYKKPNLIDFQQGDIQEEKIKSKTDMNFYNYGDGSQRSIRVPSSKPPLSRKSGCSSSKSKSKAKESTLNINPVKKETKIRKNFNNQQPQQQKKKKTLLEIAQDKEYEGSGYGGSDSQCSFNSRESFGSMNSKGSRRSQSSKKQSTLPITIKNKTTTMNQFRPSLNKINSADSQVETFSNDNQSIYNRLQEQSVRNTQRERQRPQQQYDRQERTIVSKDTYFIDQRGRLVKQDLIIKGNQIYCQQSTNRSAEQMAMQRMKRSREHHRSRSKSRDGSRLRLNKQSSSSSMEQNVYDSGSSSNFFNSSNNINSSNCNNPQYTAQKPNLYIEQFIKPIQQPYKSRQQQNYKFQKPASSNQRKIEHQFYQNNEAQYYESSYQNQEEQDEEPVRNVTLNELFGRGQKTSGNNYDQRPSNNQYAYQQSQQSYNNYNQKRQQYGNSSRFNGQDSTMKQSQRKKSLSRTEKTFYNR